MTDSPYERGMKDAMAGVFWYECPYEPDLTAAGDWLDGHDYVSQAVKRGAWFTADVKQKRAARLAAMEENEK